MPEYAEERTDQQCIVCDSDETVWVDDRLRCTDCGRRMERSPTGDYVRSRTVWWARRILTAVLIVLLMVNAARAHVLGHQPARLLSIVLLAAVLYYDGSDVAEAIRILVDDRSDGI